MGCGLESLLEFRLECESESQSESRLGSQSVYSSEYELASLSVSLLACSLESRLALRLV